ncbi:MAG: YaaR family protein [Syntrophomonadaceae bacterium]
MRIDRDKKGLDRLRTAMGSGIHEVKKSGPSSFQQELYQQKEAEVHLVMGAILQEVDRISERLRRTLSVHDLMQYKNRVKDFLQEASARAYLLKQDVGANRRGRTILITIDTIDAEIEALLSDFMKRKKDPVDVLAAIDKIRGLLVDLMI